MAMRFPDRQLTSIGEMIAAIGQYSLDGGLIWYRGHSDITWQLVPSIGRDATHLNAELTIMKRFRQNAWVHMKERPATDWEWIFVMQHHRAPTRLLDWTESPLVALFFAVAEEVHDDKDAVLWFLNPVALNRQAGHRRSYDRDVLAFGSDIQLDEYLPEKVSTRSVRLDPVAAIGPRNSTRMVAQLGTFTIMHADATPVETVGDQSHIWRMIIPKESKASLRAELTYLAVNRYTIFPELDTLAEVARKFLP